MKARIIRHALLVVMMLGGISCSIDSDIPSADSEYDMLIHSGTSYGMCFGYCVRNLELSGTDATYTMLSFNSNEYPLKSIAGEITLNEWNEITAEIDEELITSMNDVYGCPDCADGGAEWIEIITVSYSKKITFEVSDVPGSIKNLVNKLRTIRNRFNPDLE
jgi:hypothetical protein